MKIAIFSGAGISKESGIHTFRDKDDGVYNDVNIEKMVTLENFEKNPSPYYDWINERKVSYGDCKPNSAHEYLSKLQEFHDVTIITQNVDSLHEDAGSKKVLHLHGEINKTRYVLDRSNDPILFDQKTPLTFDESFTEEGQLRPHIVLFGEMPYNTSESYDVLYETDMLIIIGTSMSIGYTHSLISAANKQGVKVYYIDPDPYIDIKEYFWKTDFFFIKESATEGVKTLEQLEQLCH